MNKITPFVLSSLVVLGGCNDVNNQNNIDNNQIDTDSDVVLDVKDQFNSEIMKVMDAEELLAAYKQMNPEFFEKKYEIIFDKATITTYNNDPMQTDDSPCENGSSKLILEKTFGTGNLCLLNEFLKEDNKNSGIKNFPTGLVAIPQSNLKYISRDYNVNTSGTLEVNYGDIVRISGGLNKNCNGVFVIADAFNKRYNNKQKIDIFINNTNKHLNTKCDGALVEYIMSNEELVINQKYEEK